MISAGRISLFLPSIYMVPIYSADWKAQEALVRDLAPYYHEVQGTDHEETFLDRLFNLWFICWPLRLAAHAGDYEMLLHAQEAQKKHIAKDLKVYAYFSSSENLKWTWAQKLSLCKRCQGISSKRKACPGDFDNSLAAKHPCPRPRPRVSNIATLQDTEAAGLEKEELHGIDSRYTEEGADNCDAISEDGRNITHEDDDDKGALEDGENVTCEIEEGDKMPGSLEVD
ncbi:hypothetical protein CPB84DRAFT_1843824 [Gymnopilus junonius]|uniref:Uncharacterized protein n=1 Tax=Gymnopilus junonius TaxID=109634 RepID=A0A9P5NV73_GYMJU|nr:hypothetical protein CPB84DRAFT_1843824 [Gymnopilus junonius]